MELRSDSNCASRCATAPIEALFFLIRGLCLEADSQTCTWSMQFLHGSPPMPSRPSPHQYPL